MSKDDLTPKDSGSTPDDVAKAMERLRIVAVEMDTPYLDDAVGAVAWAIERSRLQPAAASEAPTSGEAVIPHPSPLQGEES